MGFSNRFELGLAWRTIVLLATSLDVLVWKALRRDQGLDPDATAEHLRVLVDGTLASIT